MDCTYSAEVVSKIRSEYGLEEAIVKQLVETGQSYKTTEEEFYHLGKQLLPGIPQHFILLVFETIHDHFPSINNDRRYANALAQMDDLSRNLELYFAGIMDAESNFTDRGTIVGEFMLIPVLSMILKVGIDFRCSHEVLTIVGMASTSAIVHNFFQMPDEEELRAEADGKMVEFYHPDGDYFTLLLSFEAWWKNKDNPSWCQDNFIFSDSLSKADTLRRPLYTMTDR